MEMYLFIGYIIRISYKEISLKQIVKGQEKFQLGWFFVLTALPLRLEIFQY